VEVSIALLVAFAINVAVICVGGAVCSSPKDNKQLAECADINLNTAYVLLQVHYSTVLYCTVQYSTVQYSTVFPVPVVGGAVCSSPKDDKQLADCADINLNTAYVLLQVQDSVLQDSTVGESTVQLLSKRGSQPLFSEGSGLSRALPVLFLPLYPGFQNTLGSWASTVFGIALLASGQSSTVTGTYAGQYVMAVSTPLLLPPPPPPLPA